MNLSSTPSLTLNASTRIILGDGEPFAVRHAAQALARDLERVLSAKIDIATSGRAISPEAAGAVIVIESSRTLATANRCDGDIAGEEEFVVRAITHDGKPAVLISGGGERGSVYGIYHFSHVHLSVDPLHCFTGKMPAKQDTIALHNIDYTSKPAAFRYRGWHVENVQTLFNWQGHDRGSGYWDFWDRIIETLLRLRGNMIKPNWNTPTRPEVALCQQAGLLITQEHCSPFGVGMWAIDSDKPGFNFNYEDHPEVFLNIWEKAMLSYPRPEKVIWTLGYRGRGDRPFWEIDPARYDTDAKRGAVISRVLRDQKALVERHLAKHNPAFIHNTWMEGNRLVTQGHTKVPQGVNTVYADNGYGTFRSMISEGCDPEQVAEILPTQLTGGKAGVYFHISMWDFNTPYLTNFVPPARMQEQFSKVIERQMTAYLLINVGRLRDCVSGIAAIAEIWNHGPFDAAAFQDRWCSSRFGSAAAEAKQCYDHLYHTPFKWGKWGKWDDYMVGDVGYVRRATMFIEEVLNPARRKVHEASKYKFWEGTPRALPDQLDYMQRQAEGATPGWREAVTIAQRGAEKLSGEDLHFFDLEVRSQVEIHRACNEFLLLVIQAVRSYEKGQLVEALVPARAALACVDDIQAAMMRREYRPWKGWNTPEMLRFACLPMARQWVSLLIHNIEAIAVNRPSAF